MLVSLIIIAAVFFDYLFGEVRKFHPLVGFGNIASAIEKQLNRNGYPRKTLGILSWIILVLPIPIVLWSIQLSVNLSILVDILILYFALGLNSLKAHVLNVYYALKAGDLDLAREKVSMIVSRDSQSLGEKEIARAAVETTLENGHDAVIASLFWFIIGGAPMVIIHRLANTLDAMWGYRNERFKNFGWFAARADDILGFPSAIISGGTYLLAGSSSWRDRLRSGKRSVVQCLKYKSLNGGWTIAAGAHVIGIRLGGTSEYEGEIYQSTLGEGREVETRDIEYSTQLLGKAVFIFVIFIATIEFLLEFV